MWNRIKHIWKKNWLAIVTISVSIIVMFYFLFSQGGIDTLIRISKELQVPWLFLAVGCAIGNWLLEGLVFYIIARRIYPGWSYFQALTIGMVGLLYSAITPSATGGQPIQIYQMHRLGMTTGAASSIVAMKTIIYQVVLGVYSLVMVCLRLPFFQEHVQYLTWLVLFGLVTNGAFVAFLIMVSTSRRMTDKVLRFLIKVLRKFHFSKHPQALYHKIRKEIMMFHKGTQMCGKSWKLYITTGLLTIVQLTLVCLIPYFVYRSFNLHGASAFTMTAAQAFVNMVSAFVPLPGAAGGAEGGFYLFFTAFFTDGTIVPAILLWRVISYYANIFVGCIFAVINARLKPVANLFSRKKETIAEEN